MSEKSLLEILNSYLAIEALIGSRQISEKTRREAYDTLEALDQLFADQLKEANDHGHLHNRAA